MGLRSEGRENLRDECATLVQNKVCVRHGSQTLGKKAGLSAEGEVQKEVDKPGHFLGQHQRTVGVAWGRTSVEEGWAQLRKIPGWG